jgi:hypothetical protein
MTRLVKGIALPEYFVHIIEDWVIVDMRPRLSRPATP